MKKPHWRDRAACRDCTDPEAFFSANHSVQRALINRYCNQCSVTVECLLYSKAAHADWGVWGGLTDEERRNQKRRRSWPRYPEGGT